MRTLIALVIVATALSGCAKEDSDPGPDEAGTIKDATGKTVVDDAPANETTTTGSGKKVAINKGLVFGRVHDDFNFSLQGAFVSIVGTAHFTETNSTGHYLLDNVTVGTFDVRVEMEGFRVGVQRVEIEKGNDVRLDFELPPLVPRSGGFNPHVHDYWGNEQRRVLMDHDLSINEDLMDSSSNLKPFAPGPVGAVHCGIAKCRVPFTLPEQEDGKPAIIWPGTKELRVTFSWTDATMVMDGVQLAYADPAGEADPSLTEKVLGSGETLAIPVAADQQDFGHAAWTAWRFTAVTANAPTSPGLVQGSLHVHLEIVKGDVVLDSPHPDFWQGKDQMPIGNWETSYFPNTGVLPTAADSTDHLHAFPLMPCTEEQKEEGCISIIPPGTTRVQIRFAWLESATAGQAPFDYSLSYRSSDQHPAFTSAADFREPVLVEEDLDADWRLYEVELDPAQTDGFYMQRSDWAFKWHQDTGLPYYVAQNQYRLEIQVTAFKGS